MDSNANVIRMDFLRMCNRYPLGLDDKIFLEEYPDVTLQQLVAVVNDLAQRGAISIINSPTGLKYRSTGLIQVPVENSTTATAATSDAPADVSLDPDERVVYICVSDSQNAGIWTKDIRTKTGLHQTVVNKVLKSLESKRLIRAIKPVKNPTRKLYMLSIYKPTDEVTGGPWFNADAELDSEFIDELCRVCYKFIASRSTSPKPGHILVDVFTGYPSIAQVHKFITSSGIANVALTIEDVYLLVERLVYDGLVIRKIASSVVKDHVLSDDDEDDDSDDARFTAFVYKALPGSRYIKSAFEGLPENIDLDQLLKGDQMSTDPIKKFPVASWIRDY